MTFTESKLNKIIDQSEKYSHNSISVDKGKHDTPFKRTPFKNTICGLNENETFENEQFKQVESKSSKFNSEKKNVAFSQSGSNVKERFLIKSSNFNRTKNVTMSGNKNCKIEMSEVIGNYTDSKMKENGMSQVELRTKLDFKIRKVSEEKSEEELEIDIDFDDLNAEKKA